MTKQKLKEWARANNLNYKTAWNWWRDGKLPVKAEQLPSGMILVYPNIRNETNAVLYAWVKDKSESIDQQIAKMSIYASEKAIPFNRVVSEVGDDLVEFKKLLSDAQVKTIIVSNRTSAACNLSPVATALIASGRTLAVINTGV